jgi:hypothetical protein
MGLDYAAMIADLESKKAAIEASIASLRLAAGAELGGRSNDPINVSGNDKPFDLPVGAFLNMSIPAAIKLYLSSIKRKQTVKEITTALRAGGMESTSESFENTVATALHRMKMADPPEALRFPDGWGLAELYPESLRSRLSQAQKPAKAKKKKAGKKGKREAKPPETTDAPAASSPRPEMMVEQFFARNTEGEFTTKEVAQSLGLSAQTIGLLASKLASRGILEKTPEGKFRNGKIQQMPKAV